MQVDWSILKQFVTDRSLSIQWIDIYGKYYLTALDANFKLETIIIKSDSPETDSDQYDFESNFKTNGNKRISEPKDSDGSPLQRIKITTAGWNFQLHGVEFTTSKLDSIFSKKDNGSDFGFTTIKCYDANNVLLQTQDDCDIGAVKTIIDWEPNHDYEIIGGMFKQHTVPSTDVRLWVVGVPDVPAIYGGSKLFTSNINLKFLGLEEGIKADGRSSKYLTYNAINHTNKLRIILKHDTGIKHDIHLILEIFKI